MGCRGWVLTRGCAPQDGFTPLHDAVQEGHLEMVKLLLGSGADINAKETVSERSEGDGGLGIRTRGGFGESWQPW